jgi:pyruvate,orthophosphate dikinase
VFNSWENQRARVYRQIHNISPHLGTAVNIQVMVFGNRGQDCATGVAFTRNPSTGTKAIFGEYLINAQGEDVVAGIRTPLSLSMATSEEPETSMESTMPAVYHQLLSVSHTLEQHFKDMQDIEFTVQNKKLWMLQTRNGKRTAAASLKIAVDMVAEGLITKEDAVLRVTPESLDQLLHPTLDPKAKKTFLAKGLPASPGAACGSIVFTADEAESRTRKGDAVILVRAETSPEDIHGMHAARGILTSKGGMTSHAAVVARGMGKPCVSGASSVRIDAKKKILTVAGQTFGEGDFITLDGATGEVFAGKVPTVDPNISGDFRAFMTWADGFRTLKVLTNAETTVDAQTARDFGAEGIGLCRTEHMFFAEDRLRLVREMILADNAQERVRPLQALQAMQRDDFVTILKTMAGYPVMIRLLDPPLHEFMHLQEHELADLAQHVGKSVDAVRSRLEKLKESNPMLGHRGCRLGISYPDIYEMQVRAIFQAQHIATQDIGTAAQPQIMLPLIANRAEMTLLTTMIHGVAAECFQALGQDLPYVVGTMIELPRACLVADELAESADFFSFGSNDLTQTTYGLSRDDAGSFLDAYYSQGLLSHDPFVTLDQQGVGALITMAIDRGRATKPTLKVGICGEHGGDPASIHFCHQQGMDYVSCSPYRVPIARLAAAQAALKTPKGQDQKRQVG